jgi:murein DD-endopeptidase MepM/ murein hydrolase activator NlpD
MLDQKGDSLAQPPYRLGLLHQFVFGALLLVLPALTVITAFGVAPEGAPPDVPQTLIREEIALPELDAQSAQPQRYITQERVFRGDTVAALFERLGIRDSRAMDFVRADTTGRTLFRQLVPGRTLQAVTGDDGALLTLRYFVTPTSVLEISRAADGFTARNRATAEQPRHVYKSATIRSSLFAAADAAGIPDAIAMQVARIFSTDIDFHVDLRRGDHFSVAYEMLYEAGELVSSGRILAAQFVNDGREFNAILFRDEEGVDGYYSLDGSSRAKAFLRSPVEFSRISSGFGGRLHPIFNNWRAHTGVDFAAPQGTRVLAAADGQVIAAGVRGGYGNAVEIKHGGSVTTLYGHLSAFASGIRAGARVRQGDAIGYVGRTGFATGPHLHYEFKVGGVHQDPMRVALPKAEPVAASLRQQFQRVANEARATISLLGTTNTARFE